MIKIKNRVTYNKQIHKFILSLFIPLCIYITICRSQNAHIELLLHEQQSAWNNGDIDGYMNGYWRSDSLLFTSGGNVTRGFDSTKAKYKRKYDTKEKMGTLEFSDLEICVLEENVAWVLGKWKLKRTNDEPHGIFTLVLKMFDGEWKIVHDHTSLQSVQ
jgi:ketosteroid isomerase-like protein